MRTKTPKSITHTHTHLCSELDLIFNKYENIKEQVEHLFKIMAGHFKKEEKYALPPLGLLLELSEGNWDLDEDEAIKMAEEVNSKFVELKKDHEVIYGIIEDLKKIKTEENNLDLKRFITNLELHMELEDQVLYPTAIIVGNYFKKLKNINNGQ